MNASSRTTPTTSTRAGVRRGIARATIMNLAIVLACTIALQPLAGCVSNQQSAVDAWRPPPGHTTVDRFELIRDAADHEALFTLAGGLKPMSNGIWQESFELENLDLTELRQVRRALSALRNDVWYADVQVFDNADDGERRAQAFVVHRDALARMIERHESFWGPWGITPCTHPSEIVAIVDRMPRTDRWRGYGYLFGYPDDAVDFFVEAGVAAEDGRDIGPGKDREFMQIPTHVSSTGRFTYAVPLDHVPTPTDRMLKENAGLILAAYQKRRPHLTDDDDVIETLLRLNDRFEHLSSAEEARVQGRPVVTP